jgi:hypothetical protein
VHQCMSPCKRNRRRIAGQLQIFLAVAARVPAEGQAAENKGGAPAVLIYQENAFAIEESRIWGYLV